MTIKEALDAGYSVRYRLMHDCAQAQQFARMPSVQGSLILNEEVEKFHKSCEKKVILLGAKVMTICNCDCHKKL